MSSQNEDDNPFDISNVIKASDELEAELKEKVHQLGTKRVPLYKALLHGSQFRSRLLTLRLDIMNKILSIYRARR